MKEIGNLLELLNEYNHFNSDLIYYGWDEEYERVYFHTELPKEAKEKLGDALFDDGINEQRIDDERIISKKFGFIKWLVENEKIGDNKNSDRYTMMKLMRAEINEGTEVFEGTERYEFVIMLLAIQDEPINFLISILKNVEKTD